MKTALIAFNDFDLERARETFFKSGITISTAEILSKDDDIGFKRGYELFHDTADVLIVADGADFDLKETVAEFSGTPLIENENARRVIEKNGFTDFSGALMPPDATVIPNECGAYQGFTVEDRDFTLIILSGVKDEFFFSCEKFVLPYLAEKEGKGKSLFFKCFGKKSDVDAVLSGLKTEFSFDYRIAESLCDLSVSVFFGGAAGSDSDFDYRNATREIAFGLKDKSYADSDVSLSETLFTLLRLSGKKISVAESFTGGNVAAEIIKNSGASEYFAEGVVAYSNESKVKRLSVSANDIAAHGAVSAKVAFRMAAGLFNSANPDVVVATTGLAGPNGDGTGVPVGRCFIAAGTKRGIHTYKFDFTGNREEITKKGVNAALFYAVKTIKNFI